MWGHLRRVYARGLTSDAWDLADPSAWPPVFEDTFLCVSFRLIRCEQLELLSMAGGKGSDRAQRTDWQLALSSSIQPVPAILPHRYIPIQEKAMHMFRH